MDLAFSSVANGSYSLGAACHQQQQGAVPVWVVTDVHGNILINNQAELEDKPVWVVSKGRITVTRFWSASTAMVVCNVENLTRGEDEPSPIFPPLPNTPIRVLSGGRGYGRLPYPLDKNDEICIWCGYIESLRPVSQVDLKSGKLTRTFVGVIDTLVGSGTVNMGTTLIIQCRDRMKYLMDSMSTYNSTDMAPIGLAAKLSDDANQTGLDTAKQGDSISRTQVLLEIARRSIGHLENAYSIAQKPEGDNSPCSSVCGLKISQGYTKDFISDLESADDIYAVYDGPQGSRDYFGIEMSDSSAPPPNTTLTPAGLGWVDDTRLDPKGQANKYLDLMKKYEIDKYWQTEAWFTNITNTWNQGAADHLKDRFLQEYKKKFGKDYEIPVEAPTDIETLATRLLDEMDSKLTPREVRDKYVDLFKKNNIGIIGVWTGDYIIEGVSANVAAGVKAEFLKRYKAEKGVEYATTVPEFREQIAKLNSEIEKAGAPFIGGTTVTPKGLSDIDLAIRARHPAFNIITGRKAYDTGEEGKSFTGMSAQVTDRVPVEYIKFLAMQEPWPTEFFCDHRSGEYWYAPRGLDVTGLSDPKRFRRTYFFRYASKEVLATLNQPYAHPAQALLLFREESSCINWRSNIIVTNSPSTESADTWAVHLKVIPPFLQGRAFACTYYTVVDSTISNDSTELFATAMSFARLYGKELRAASMHLIGDPTLCPGEAVQVLGSPLSGGGYAPAVQEPSTPQWQWDREAVMSYYNEYKNVHKDLIQELRDLDTSMGDKEANKILSKAFGLDESGMTPAEVIKKYLDLAKENDLPDITYIPDNKTPKDQAEFIKKEFEKAYNAKYGRRKADDPRVVNDSNRVLVDSLLSEQGLTPAEVIAKYNRIAKDHGMPNLAQPSESMSDADKVAAIKSAFENSYQQKFSNNYAEGREKMRTYLLEQSNKNSNDSSSQTSLQALIQQTKQTDSVRVDQLTQAEMMCPATFVGSDTRASDLDLSNPAPAGTPTIGNTQFSVDSNTRLDMFSTPTGNTIGQTTFPAPVGGNTRLNMFSTPVGGTAGNTTFPTSTGTTTGNTTLPENNTTRPSNTGGMNVDKQSVYIDDPKTVWRVEAVIHKFNDSPGDGYKTEVALLTPW